MPTIQQMQAAWQQECGTAARMAAALGLPDDPQPALPMHWNLHNVTTAFEAAFGDGPNQDNMFGRTGPSQSIDSGIGQGG